MAPIDLWADYALPWPAVVAMVWAALTLADWLLLAAVGWLIYKLNKNNRGEKS